MAQFMERYQKTDEEDESEVRHTKLHTMSKSFGNTLLLALLALGLLSCLRSHPQREGNYALQFQGLIRDDCHLISSNVSNWSGQLRLEGNVVFLTLHPWEVKMVGQYSDVEQTFTLDGDANNVDATAAGANCQQSMANLNLRATTRTVDQFDATLTIQTKANTVGTCQCVGSAHLLAQRAGD